jgi:hypothetical protein
MPISGVSSPIVKDGRIVGFYDSYSDRQFAVDMSGFAVGLDTLRVSTRQRITYSKHTNPPEGTSTSPHSRRCRSETP